MLVLGVSYFDGNLKVCFTAQHVKEVSVLPSKTEPDLWEFLMVADGGISESLMRNSLAWLSPFIHFRQRKPCHKNQHACRELMWFMWILLWNQHLFWLSNFAIVLPVQPYLINNDILMFNNVALYQERSSILILCFHKDRGLASARFEKRMINDASQLWKCLPHLLGQWINR